MTKPALDYLRASGAVPISIIGGLIQWPGTPGVAATYWTSSAVAKPMVRRAREIMGMEQTSPQQLPSIRPPNP